jgi:transposase
VARTWARRGQTPPLKRLSRRKALQSAVALSLRGRIYKRTFRRTINGECVVVALGHVRRQVGGGFILVWDRSPTHRSRVVAAYLAAHPEIVVEWLPPYAPELNPEEYCHGNVKERMRNSAPSSVEQMQQQVERGFNRLRRRPDLLLNFIRHAGLKVKQLF